MEGKMHCPQNCGEVYRKFLICKAFILFGIIAVFLIAGGYSSILSAGEHDGPGMKSEKPVPDIEHPIKKPEMYSKVMRCPNCGMMINMWARTRHSFSHPEGDFTTCSIRCMADKEVSSGAAPTKGQVALYLDPGTMVPVESAWYVIGSTAQGTMTMKSKIAFADNGTAEEFAAKYGGTVADFETTYATAKMELPKSRLLIDKKRKKTGKIKEPTEKDSCVVCGMYPARFPRHNSQILGMDGNTLHFCSTKCMINFNADPVKHMQEAPAVKMAWVTLFSDGMYESAFGAYYVIGSSVDGPMGKEAIPFKMKSSAEEFIRTNGGKIVTYPQLAPHMVGGGH